MGMKVTIVGGAGTVGSTAAYRIAQEAAVSEIVLVDPRRNVCEAHALDIEQAMVFRTGVRVRAGEIKDTENSHIIIVAVAVWGRGPVATRGLTLEEDMKLLMEVMPSLITASPSALWIVVSAPLDVLVYWIHHTFSIPRKRLIGFNRNDTARLCWAVGKVLSVPAPDVEAYVIGEHGETQVPVMSRIRVRGEKVTLDAAQREKVKSLVDGFLPRWNSLQPGRTAGWATGESLGDMVTSAAAEDGRIIVCSSVLEGEYGLRNVSLGVPMRLGREGVKEIIEFNLDAGERDGLQVSAAKIREQITKGQGFVDEFVQRTENLLPLLKGGTRS